MPCQSKSELSNYHITLMIRYCLTLVVWKLGLRPTQYQDDTHCGLTALKHTSNPHQAHIKPHSMW